MTEASPEARPTPGLTARARRLFDAGDYAALRALVAQKVEHAGLEDHAELQTLRRRTEIDWVQAAVLLGCLSFFVIIAYRYVP